MKCILQGLCGNGGWVFAAVSAIVLGGCGEGSSSPELGAPSPPATASIPDGGMPDGKEGGGPLPEAESSFGPDICGNGKDDDGNGVIDDGCSVPACSLGVLRQFDIPLHTSLVFDHGRGIIAAYGGPLTNDVPSTQGIWQYDETGKELAPRRPIIWTRKESALLKTKGGYLAFGVAEPPLPPGPMPGLTLPLDEALVTRAPGKPTVQTSYVAVANGTMWSSMDGSALITDDGSSIDIRAFDASTASEVANYKIKIDAGKGTQRLYALGGVPVYGRAASSGGALRTQLVRLGAKAPAWTSAVMTATAQGGLEYPDTFNAAARSAGVVATCTGGYVNRSAGYRFACHTVDVTNGQRIADFAIGYPFSDDMSSNIDMEWGSDDGWVVARLPSNPFAPGAVPTQTVRIDAISKSGKLTANLLEVTIPPLANQGGARAFQALGPNLYALVSDRETAGGGYPTEVVTLIGCK